MIEIIISYYSRQMGQEQTIPQPHSARNYHFQSNTEIKNQFKSNQSKEHEGILKLRSTPFPDCVQISNDGMLLFLQNAQATLQQLLENRLYTNRLFPLEDVEKLIESIVYTLAYLSESNIVYRDLCPANIYYCDGVFKLLPNQLIEQQFYDKAYQNFYGLHQNEQQADFSYLSPELIIALRMKQKQVLDFDILSKSNVFIFGLILLESTTLLPSSQCYDPSNYDIFNNVISQRLDLVQQHYNQCIARIIANMLDYDFNQRMDIKQLSIWINRELMTYRKQLRKSFETEEKKTLNPNKSSVVLHKSRFVTHEAQKQVAQQSSPVVVQEPQSNPSRSYSRSNMVYIKGYDDNGKEDAKPGDALRGAKNCIYLQALPQYEVDYQLDKKIEQRNHQLQTDIRSRIPPTNLYAQNRNSYSQHHNIYTDNREARTYLQSRSTIIENRNPYQESRSYQRGSNKFNYQLEQKNLKHGAETDTCYSQENRLNRDYSKPAEKASFVPYIAPQPTQSTFLREVANIRAKIEESEPNMTKSGQNSEFMKDQNAITAKLRNQNKFYPSLSELQNAQRQTESTKRIAKHSEVGRNSRAKQCFDSKQSKQSDSKCSVNDGSINRIKLEIQKSRKLIEEFRKTEGLVQ